MIEEKVIISLKLLNKMQRENKDFKKLCRECAEEFSEINPCHCCLTDRYYCEYWYKHFTNETPRKGQKLKARCEWSKDWESSIDKLKKAGE